MKKLAPYIAAVWALAISAAYYLQYRDKFEPVVKQLFAAAGF